MTTELLRNIDALLITDPTNIRYLTGFVGLSSHEQEAYVLVTLDTLYLFTHSMYIEQAKQLPGNPLLKLPKFQIKSLEIIEISHEDPLAQRLKELLDDLKQGWSLKPIKVGFEENNLTFAEYQNLKGGLTNVVLVPTRRRVEALRQIKRPEEIAHIKRAVRLTDKSFTHIIKRLKPGITESAIAWEIEKFFHKNGAESAFSPIVAFGKNSSQPHYAPSPSSKLQAQSLILLDFGARVSGYCADMTRVVFMGNPSPEQKKVYQTVFEAQQKALDESYRFFDISIHRKAKSNISGAYLDRIAREHIERAGYPPYPHSLGHNVGLAIHEGPRLSVKKDEELKPGMVFTIEPAVYLEGKFGIRIEDLVLLKKEGIEILTKSPKILTVL